MKIPKVIFALLLAAVALTAIIVSRQPRNSSDTGSQPPKIAAAPATAKVPPAVATPGEARPANSTIPLATRRAGIHSIAGQATDSTNKLERLTQIRENFHTLAAGDRATAIRAAKEIKDENEREAALFTLVSEWTKGELGTARARAQAIDMYGLEAGLGMELAKDPALALLWANELTDSAGHAAVLHAAAANMVASDPTAAFALGEQVPLENRAKFTAAVYASWAGEDTSAALKWAEQLPDPADRESALQAIRSAAPVGIGAALKMEDGFPVIQQVMSGTPAELSGQLHPGDRILALAQGDNAFVTARGVSLQDAVNLIRGAPNTVLQLQILPADAPPDSTPKVISIVRDQIKFKK